MVRHTGRTQKKRTAKRSAKKKSKLTKRFYGWPEDAKFLVPDGVRENFRDVIGKRGKQLSGQWNTLFNKYSAQYPDLAAQYERMLSRRICPTDGTRNFPLFAADAKGIATRDSSAKVLNAIAKNDPWLMGGSADLYPSTKTRLTFDTAGDFEAGNYNARNFHFGIREHAMGAIVNGMTLSKIRAYGSTFLIFTDYMKPAIRLSAHHGDSLDLDLHPRFHRRRRRRTHAPAHRATGHAASGSGSDDAAPRRRQ